VLTQRGTAWRRSESGRWSPRPTQRLRQLYQTGGCLLKGAPWWTERLVSAFSRLGVHVLRDDISIPVVHHKHTLQGTGIGAGAGAGVGAGAPLLHEPTAGGALTRSSPPPPPPPPPLPLPLPWPGPFGTPPLAPRGPQLGPGRRPGVPGTHHTGAGGSLGSDGAAQLRPWRACTASALCEGLTEGSACKLRSFAVPVQVVHLRCAGGGLPPCALGEAPDPGT